MVCGKDNQLSCPHSRHRDLWNPTCHSHKLRRTLGTQGGPGTTCLPSELTIARTVAHHAYSSALLLILSTVPLAQNSLSFALCLSTSNLFCRAGFKNPLPLPQCSRGLPVSRLEAVTLESPWAQVLTWPLPSCVTLDIWSLKSSGVDSANLTGLGERGNEIGCDVQQPQGPQGQATSSRPIFLS